VAVNQPSLLPFIVAVKVARIFPSSQMLAYASVRSRPHLLFLSDTRKCQCPCSPSSSPSVKYSHMPVFVLGLIFTSSQILANSSVRARPHLPLLSDTRKYKCSRSASSSPLLSCSQYQCSQSASSFSLLRYSQIPMFALSLIFPSSQTLANASVRAQPHFSLLSDTCNYYCSHSAWYSPPLILATASIRAQAHIPLFSDTRKCQRSCLQMPVVALRLIYPSSQIVANISVCAHDHIPLPPDRRKYERSLLSDRRKCQCLHSASHSPPLRSSQLQCSRSASYLPPLRYSQIQVFALANTSVRALAHIPLLPDCRKYQRLRSGSYSPHLRSSQVLLLHFRYWQMPLFALSLKFLSSQIVANSHVCGRPSIPLLSDTRKY
jgi:hypothetical protein